MPATEKIWTVEAVLNWTVKRFAQSKLSTPLLDAQLLLAKVLNFSKIQLYMEIDKPLSTQERLDLRLLVQRRLSGEPVAYILGEKHWADLKFIIDKRVLIPRPETECLLYFVLESIAFYQQKPKIIFDLFTGSGCIAIALAKKFPDALIIGIDCSAQALAVAQENAQLHKVTNVQWKILDLADEQSYNLLYKDYRYADIITANPPYISAIEWEMLDVSVKNYEPKLALYAADDGLLFSKIIMQYIKKFYLLNNKFGVMAIEMGHLHPQKLLDDNIKKYRFSSNIQDKVVNEYFALADLDDKSRFLCLMQIN